MRRLGSYSVWKLPFPLAFLCLSLCKSQSPTPTATPAVKACTEASCETGSLAKVKASCLSNLGATWNTGSQTCNVASSLAMCQVASADLVWDGMQCVTQASVPNFYRWCINASAPASILQTLAIIARNYNGSNCQAMNFDLVSHTQLVYQEAGLIDLTPLAAFTQLISLNLWDNKIQDLTPLAGLTNLQVLNLGHNLITDIGPLAGLKNLKQLLLFENSISDLSPLAGLTNLQVLDLRSNPIADYSVVDALKISEVLKGSIALVSSDGTLASSGTASSTSVSPTPVVLPTSVVTTATKSP